MKKMNKKGFTIVELVIVIAVIAILAAVMIPTFGGIIEKANKSSVQQTAQSLYKQALALDLADGVQNNAEGETAITEVDDTPVTYTVTTTDGNIVINFKYTDTSKKLTAVFDGTEWTVRDAEAAELTTPAAGT